MSIGAAASGTLIVAERVAVSPRESAFSLSLDALVEALEYDGSTRRPRFCRSFSARYSTNSSQSSATALTPLSEARRVL